jgi:hypothetical protein
MSCCVVRCCGPRLERRRLRAASPSAAAAPHAPLRCRAEAGALRAGGQSAALNRRLALAAGAAASLLRAERAAAEEEDDATWARYTRAFRARFETSISSATRAYTFEYPSSWGPGARWRQSRWAPEAVTLSAVPRAEIVSLNDGKLYGVDLRLRNKQEGVQLAVSLLPYGAVLRAQSSVDPRFFPNGLASVSRARYGRGRRHAGAGVGAGSRARAGRGGSRE